MTQHRYSFSFCLLVVLSGINASRAQQSLPLPEPYVINTAGHYLQLSGALFDFNLGELVIETAVAGNTLLSQGFLQPRLAINVPAQPEPEACFLPLQINNVITPNGDGRNDRLQFRCLDNFPGNRLTLFDRAGRRIYLASPYRNDWDGRLGGRLLDEGTYYYILEAGHNLGQVTGFVSVIREEQ